MFLCSVLELPLHSALVALVHQFDKMFIIVMMLLILWMLC